MKPVKPGDLIVYGEGEFEDWEEVDDIENRDYFTVKEGDLALVTDTSHDEFFNLVWLMHRKTARWNYNVIYNKRFRVVKRSPV